MPHDPSNFLPSSKFDRPHLFLHIPLPLIPSNQAPFSRRYQPHYHSSSSSSSMGVSGEQTAWSKGGMGNDVSSLRQSLRGMFTIPLTELSLSSRSLRTDQICTASGVSLFMHVNYLLQFNHSVHREAWPLCKCAAPRAKGMQAHLCASKRLAHIHERTVCNLEMAQQRVLCSISGGD